MSVSFRFIRLLLVMVGVLFLVGCTDKNNNESPKYVLENGNHAIMGPLKDAIINVYGLDDLENSIEETTTDDLGKFDLSLDNINEDTLLLVSISGGSDIDANDDGVLDEVPTENKGTIHGFAKASELKAKSVNVTLVSEIVYQYTKHLIGEIHNDDLEDIISGISYKLLKEESRNREAINKFNPLADLDKLSFNYKDLIDGTDSLVKIYHTDYNITKIEDKINKIFAGTTLSFKNMRLLENAKYSKIVLGKPINSKITATNSAIYVDLDNNSSQLVDFIKKDTNLSFTITLNENMKILGWDGCDSLSDDLLTCRLTTIKKLHRIEPNVVYTETKYADNVRDLTDYRVDINDTNYSVVLDDIDEVGKEYLTDIEIDNIIISTNPTTPFFRKVINATKIDDTHYIFETEPTSFLNLYKEGSIYTNRNLTHEDLVVQSTNSGRRSKLIYSSNNGMRLLPPRHQNDDKFVIVFGEDVDRNMRTVNGDIDIEVNENVTVKGSLSFTIKPEFNYNIEWFSLKSMKTVVTQEMKVQLSVEAKKEFEMLEKEYWKHTLARFDFIIPSTPIVINIKLDGSVLVDVKVGGYITIGGEYTRVSKNGFSNTNGVVKLINDVETSGGVIGEAKATISAGQYLQLSPTVTINEIAGFALDTKLGLSEEISSLSLSTYNLDGDTKLFSGKVDAVGEVKLNWVWGKYLKNFTWAENFSKALNKQLDRGTIKSSYTLAEWDGEHVGKNPAYLKVISDVGTDMLKYNDESVDERYTYKVKNTGEDTLKWKLEVSGELKDSIVFTPKSGELAKGEDIEVDVFFVKDNLSSEIGKHKAYLKFINLTDTQSSNAKTGTTIENIKLKVIERLEAPSNLNINITGTNIRKVNFDWDNSNQNLRGFNLYLYKFDETTQSCSTSIATKFITLNTASENSIELDTLTNNGKSFFEDSDKYCFRVSAYQLILDWFDSSINESELSSEVVLDVEEAKFVVEDTSTKWMDTASETMNWDDAMQYCSNNGGRLPTIDELEEVLTDCTEGTINLPPNDSYYLSCYKDNGFTSSSYWSSNTYENNTDNAWHVYFDYSHALDTNKDNIHSVRCIIDNGSGGSLATDIDNPNTPTLDPIPELGED